MLSFKPLRNFSTKINFGKPTYIVAAKRTPVATFLGKLAKFKGPELGSIAIKSALNSINLLGTDVNEVIMGTGCQAGQGQNPTRQASLGGGKTFFRYFIIKLFLCFVVFIRSWH